MSEAQPVTERKLEIGSIVQSVISSGILAAMIWVATSIDDIKSKMNAIMVAQGVQGNEIKYLSASVMKQREELDKLKSFVYKQFYNGVKRNE